VKNIEDMSYIERFEYRWCNTLPENQMTQVRGSQLFSGEMVGDEKFRNQLITTLESGNFLMVYDPSNVNHFRRLDGSKELHDYINSTMDYMKHRYVLLEQSTAQNVIYSEFKLLRAYKLTFNMPL